MISDQSLSSLQKFFIAALVIFIPAVFFPYLSDNTLYPRFFMWCVLLLIYLFCNKGLFKHINGSKMQFAALSVILPGFVLWVLTTSFFARNNSESFTVFFKMLLMVITATIFHDLISKVNDWLLYLLKCTVLICVILNLVMVYQVFSFGINFTDYDSIIKITSLNGNKNLYTEFILICLPFCILSLLRHASAWRYVSLFACGLSVFAIVFLQSRGVWLALFLMLGVFVWCLWSRNKLFVKFNKNKVILAGLLIPVLLLGLMLLVYQNIGKSILARAQSIVNLKENGSASGRLVLWQQTMNIVKQQPLTGVGGNNWKTEFQQYGQKDFITVFNTKPMNDYVLVLAEQGIIGLIFYLFIITWGIIMLFKLVLRGESKEQFFNHTIMLCSLIAFATVSFFSFTMERSENLILLSILLGYVIFYSKRKFTMKNLWVNKCSTVLRPLLIVLLLFGTVFFFFKIRGEYFNTKIQIARKHENHIGVIEYASKAQSLFYVADETATPIAWYSGISKFLLNDKSAVDDFEKAYRVNPYHLHVLNNLATVYDHKGDKERAIELYNRAIEISPKFNDAIYNLAVVYFNQGKYLEARNTIGKWHGRKNENVVYLSTLLKANLGIKLTRNDKKILSRHR